MIAAKNVSKVFRIYQRPRHWVAEKLAGRKRHHVVTALSGVSFEVKAGECLGVVGQNGSGKSTLLRVLAGISPPSAGEVVAEGRLSAILELDSGFHPEFTGRENIRIGSAVLGLSSDEARAREEEVVAFSGLAEFIDLPVRTYSSGMYLRLGFALATAVSPEVLLVDEALSVGDEWFRGRCVDRIRQIRETGAAVVIVSHDLTMVRALCDRAMLLHHGRAAAEGAPAEVINAYLETIYEEAARQAGPSQFASDRPRRGTGEVEITAVRMFDHHGRALAVAQAGKLVVIEMDYRAHQDCVSPLFGLNIFRSDGVLAVCTNTEAAMLTNRAFQPDAEPGDHPERIPAGHTGTARFEVERLPLLAGDYELSVNIYRGRSGAHVAVDEVLGVQRFQVVNGDHVDLGLCLCPGKWKIS